MHNRMVMRGLSTHHASESKPEHVSTGSPLVDVDAVESILNEWHQDVASRVPEFWSMRVLESLSQLFRGVSASLYRGGADLGGQQATTKSLLVEIRDLLDQLWWADWPMISSGFERQLRDVLVRLRENEERLRPPAPRAHSPAP